MFSRAFLAAALATMCFHEACCAIPFAVNHTALQRTHPLTATNSGLNTWGRRRARDTQIQLTTPSPLQTSSPQLGPYFANYSSVGQEVECSDAAKRCLAINRLLHEPSGLCYELGDFTPCRSNGGRLTLDAESFRRGQLRSKCSDPDSCRGFNMAYDGKCYDTREIYGKLCNGSRELMFNILGGFECRIPEQQQDRVKIVRQTNSAGRCVIPNLQNNDIGRYWVECSTRDEECLNVGLLPFRGDCHAPLSKTSCPEGQWLVLDESATETRRLSAKCVSSQPCGSDAQLLRADRSCHANTDLSAKLCNGYYVFPLPTGDFICTAVPHRYILKLWSKENGLCDVRVRQDPGYDSTIQVGGNNCVLNDQMICQPEVKSPNPKPDLGSER